MATKRGKLRVGRVLLCINVLLEQKVTGEIPETYGRNSRKIRE